MRRSPGDLIRAFYAVIERAQPAEELAALLTEDASTLTHPNAISPGGRRTDRREMLAGHEAGARLLANQTFEIRSILEMGAMAVVRLRWTGLVARAAGPFREGQVLTAHVAQFVETRDGRIASIETFDCYEPLDG